MRCVAVVLLSSLTAAAAPTRTFFTLPSSNGYGAVIGDTSQAKITHFRERLPATEEPQLDADAGEIWVGNQQQIINSRDLAYDVYFGLRTGGTQLWLSSVPVTSSTYESGIVEWTQQTGGVTVTTYVFAPRALPHAGFVMILHVQGAAGAAFSLHNFHMGYGRPGVMTPDDPNGETLTFTPDGTRDALERGFAGVVVARPLGTVQHAMGFNAGSPASANAFQIVQDGGTADLQDSTGDQPVADDSVSAFQFATPGTDSWVGVAFAHSGDPFGGAEVQGWLDTYVGTQTAQQLLTAEQASWSAFQSGLTLPASLTPDETTVARQSAVMLEMARVQESQTYLREFLTRDGEPRYTRFPGTLPATITHKGQGAVLASLPPGEWTWAWVRDSAYSATAMASVGMKTQATGVLQFMLDAEGGRFQNWSELASYAFPPYVISLVRYTGFGVENTDFNDFGPNLELDGFGLTLWAIAQVNDQAFIDANWETVAGKIADPLASLIDPVTHLVRADSSIWETHWNGHQRSWTYTNLTAVRGLCDAATIADARSDSRGAGWRATALALRSTIAHTLTDHTGALASNLEELQSGSGYYDAAVLDAFALGLFDPHGHIAQATLAALNQHLAAHAGPGWSRNDDNSDHAGMTDLSPWGSDYDSAEWVFTDLRGSALKATRDWTTASAAANLGVIPETYDENTGAWKFNAPMVGFGAGAYLLALQPPLGPACGAYFDESTLVPDGGMPMSNPDSGTPVTPDGGTMQPKLPTACGCHEVSGTGLFLIALLLSRRVRRPLWKSK